MHGNKDIKYRIEHERLLTVNSDEGFFIYKGKRIVCLSMYFEVRAYDGNDKEIEHFCDCEKSPSDDGLSRLFRFDVDENSETGYTITKTDTVRHYPFHRIEIVPTKGFISDFSKNSTYCDLNIEITHKEFIDILTHNMKYFNYSNNKPAQSTAYGINYYT